MLGHLAAVIKRIPPEREFLAAVALAAGALWGFIELADEVLEGETRGIDRRLLLLFREPGDLADPVGPQWLEEMMRDFTALGGIGVLALLTAAVTGYLLLDGNRRAAIATFIAVSGGQLLSLLLKAGFGQSRPDLVPHEVAIYTASFPSGHSMMAAITYLTLAAMLAAVASRRRHKVYVLLLAGMLTVLVGTSRVYLGVHWPSDVLGGWTIGACWALVCWTVQRYMSKDEG